MTRLSQVQMGALCATGAVVCFTTNDTTVKFLSGGYALHQIILIRSILGLAITLLVLAPFHGGLKVFRTERLSAHLLRSFFVFVANMAFFLGLATMPLADATAIFFISPLLITLFSVVFLQEYVGPWRWAAIGIGFIGVVVMMRPGTTAFQYTTFLPVIAAFAYAALHTMTRALGKTESAVTLSVYIQMMFIIASILIGLAVGDGKFGDQSDPSLHFLLRPWVWPDQSDLPFFAILGVGVSGAGFLISQAYRVAAASFVAPFEYLTLPLAVLFGILIFDEWPDAIAYFGMTLILLAGVLTIWRDAVHARAPGPAR